MKFTIDNNAECTILCYKTGYQDFTLRHTVQVRPKSVLDQLSVLMFLLGLKNYVNVITAPHLEKWI